MSEKEKEAIEEFKREYDDGRILESDIIIELNTARIVIDLIEKQQKVIDLMAEELERYGIGSAERYKEYFYKKAEEENE